MNDSKTDKSAEPIWQAYGPAKDQWKAAGNYYTAEELARMEKDFSDLIISPIPKKIYDAD